PAYEIHDRLVGSEIFIRDTVIDFLNFFSKKKKKSKIFFEGEKNKKWAILIVKTMTVLVQKTWILVIWK
ncbi:MAG: hypothetical protein K2O21_01165, partial [Malacoplasma sp.]|nr:hypothetical protein [Malacoplasma sp.]